MTEVGVVAGSDRERGQGQLVALERVVEVTTHPVDVTGLPQDRGHLKPVTDAPGQLLCLPDRQPAVLVQCHHVSCLVLDPCHISHSGRL
ncbi:MAG: hypothetical protein ACT4NY_11465 [Pseudonocardiales bacterium]